MSSFSVRVILGALAVTACDYHSNAIGPHTECLAAIPILITPRDTSVQVGDSLRLLAVVNPPECWTSLELNRGVRWVSHDTTVAVIDSVTGLLEARSPGAVDIGAHAIPSPVEYGVATVTVTP